MSDIELQQARAFADQWMHELDDDWRQVVGTFIAEVDRLRSIIEKLDRRGWPQFDRLTRLGNALSDAVGSCARTQAVEDARKAWNDEVGR